ncbi:unnamed protein product [Merluccius merluccius]
MEEMLTCNRSPFSQVFGRQGQLMQAMLLAMRGAAAFRGNIGAIVMQEGGSGGRQVKQRRRHASPALGGKRRRPLVPTAAFIRFL